MEVTQAHSYNREGAKDLLLSECSHRPAIDEAAWPLRILKLNTIPKPCEHEGGGFAETGWDVGELRAAGCARIATGKPSLVVEWFMAARCAIEKPVEARRVHNSPPSTISFSRCLLLNCMKSPQSRQSGPALRRFPACFHSCTRRSYGMRARKSSFTA